MRFPKMLVTLAAMAATPLVVEDAAIADAPAAERNVDHRPAAANERASALEHPRQVEQNGAPSAVRSERAITPEGSATPPTSAAARTQQASADPGTANGTEASSSPVATHVLSASPRAAEPAADASASPSADARAGVATDAAAPATQQPRPAQDGISDQAAASEDQDSADTEDADNATAQEAPRGPEQRRPEPDSAPPPPPRTADDASIVTHVTPDDVPDTEVVSLDGTLVSKSTDEVVLRDGNGNEHHLRITDRTRYVWSEAASPGDLQPGARIRAEYASVSQQRLLLSVWVFGRS